jgi:hypothetical protein
MKRRYVLSLTLLTLLVAGFFLWQLVLSWFVRPSLPRPHSDVLITSDIGWWANQEGLNISDFSAQAIDPRLGLFSSRFLMRYRMKGTVKSQKGWRPKVKEAQITERVVSRSNNWSTSVADFLIVPVVGVEQDKTYFGEQIPFDLKLEQIIHTMGWGLNRYEIKCGEKTASVIVEQVK